MPALRDGGPFYDDCRAGDGESIPVFGHVGTAGEAASGLLALGRELAGGKKLVRGAILVVSVRCDRCSELEYREDREE